MYKTLTTALRASEMQSPFGDWRHQRGESHRRWLIIVMPILPYDTESKSRNADSILIAREGDTITLGPKGRQT